MTDVFVERDFDPTVGFEDVLDMARDAFGCFGIYRVGWNQSFLNRAGNRMLCWFDAPDAEAPRMAMRQAGSQLPDALWPGTVHDGPASDLGIRDANVMVERRFDEPVTLDEIQAIEDASAACLETRDVTFVKTFFSRDRKRMMCLYQAPDAEAVRQAQREAGMPVESIWACRPIGPTDLDTGTHEE